MDVRKAAEAARDYLVSIRREFHQHPELSMQEFRTAQRIEEELDRLGIPHTRVGETGVLARCAAKRRAEEPSSCARTSMRSPLRRRMNARTARRIPASCTPAAMMRTRPACSAVRRSSRSTGTPSGARCGWCFSRQRRSGRRKAVHRGGVLDGAERVFGLHTAHDLRSGTVGLKPGLNNAAVDHFRIEVHGKSTHVSTPHLGTDALYIARPRSSSRCRDWHHAHDLADRAGHHKAPGC